MSITRLDAFFETRPRVFWFISGPLLVLLVGLADYYTGADVALSLFYLTPIAAAAWYAGRGLGVALAFASAATWLLDEYLTRRMPLSPPLLLWNGGVRLGTFLIVALLLSALRRTLEKERQLSRTDSLTGAANWRSFREQLEAEIERSRRYQHPFSLAYIDLDNFKTVNDSYGHSTGDQLLATTVQIMRQNLREYDIVARLGGDEFALLLPETDAPAARVILSRLREALLDEMQQEHCMVTFSIGVLTYQAGAEAADLPGADELLKTADQLMYTVKLGSKDEIVYADYP